MSQSVYDRKRTFKATNDLSAKQFYLVALDTSNQNQVVLANAQTLPIIGVLHNAPAAGDVAEVNLKGSFGTARVLAGGAIAIGAKVTANASGQAVSATQTTAGSQPAVQVIGEALEAASTSGDIIEILLTNYPF